MATTQVSEARSKRTSRKPAVTARKPRRAASSLGDEAYEAIKHEIITCRLKPGEYVNEMQLSNGLRIGRTPIHQALNRLMLEGMVDIIPRKGVIVKPLSLSEVLHVTEARVINESHGARLAATLAEDEDIDALEDIMERTRHWAAAHNTERMMLLDREFHLALAKAGKNTVLAEILRNLHERSLRFWFLSFNTPGRYEGVLEEHEAVFQAIKKRDPDESERAIRAHIESSGRVYRSFFEFGEVSAALARRA